MKWKHYLIYLMAVWAVLSSVALANTIEVAYVAVEAGGQENVVLNGSGHSGANGALAINTRNPVGPLAQLIGDEQLAYCYELTAYADFAFRTYNVQALDSALGNVKANLIGQLWAQHYNPAWQSDTYIYFGGSHGGWTADQPANTTENQQALALNLAIYEITYDFDTTLGSLDLTGGSFKVSSTNPSAATGLAADWLSDLVEPGAYTGQLAQLLSISNCSYQDFIIEIPGSSDVPEPTSLLMLLGSLPLLSGKAFNKKK